MEFNHLNDSKMNESHGNTEVDASKQTLTGQYLSAGAQGITQSMAGELADHTVEEEGVKQVKL